MSIYRIYGLDHTNWFGVHKLSEQKTSPIQLDSFGDCGHWAFYSVWNRNSFSFLFNGGGEQGLNLGMTGGARSDSLSVVTVSLGTWV